MGPSRILHAIKKREVKKKREVGPTRKEKIKKNKKRYQTKRDQFYRIVMEVVGLIRDSIVKT